MISHFCSSHLRRNFAQEALLQTSCGRGDLSANTSCFARRTAFWRAWWASFGLLGQSSTGTWRPGMFSCLSSFNQRCAPSVGPSSLELTLPCVQVSDFGYSQQLKREDDTKLGPVKWQAPEVIKECEFSEKSGSLTGSVAGSGIFLLTITFRCVGVWCNADRVGHWQGALP